MVLGVFSALSQDPAEFLSLGNVGGGEKDEDGTEGLHDGKRWKWIDTMIRCGWCCGWAKTEIMRGSKRSI